MRGQRVVGQTAALCFQLQHLLAGLEKHLDIPAFAVNADDFFFGKLRIGADHRQPVLFVGTVSDANDLRGNLVLHAFFIGIASVYDCRNDVFGTLRLLFATTEDPLDVQLFTVVLIIGFRGFLYHRDRIRTTLLFDADDLFGIGKPAVKQHIFGFMTSIR